MPTWYSMPIEMSTSACVVDARRVGARPRAVRRVAPASRVDLHAGRATHVAADGLADLEHPLTGLVLEILYRGLELGRHEVAVDVVPAVAVSGAGERHPVCTGPHLGAIGARFASKVHPHRHKISRAMSGARASAVPGVAQDARVNHAAIALFIAMSAILHPCRPSPPPDEEIPVSTPAPAPRPVADLAGAGASTGSAGG